MTSNNLPDSVRENDPSAPWNKGDHLPGCPRLDGAPEMCTCGHRKDPDGKEPGHRLGVCQAVVDRGISRMPCGCDGYERVEPECECAKIRLEAAANKAQAREDAAQERGGR